MNSILDFIRVQEADSLYLFWMKEILVALLIFGFSYLLSRFVKYALINWGTKFTSFTKSDLDDRILARITPPISHLVVVAGLYYAIATLKLSSGLATALSGIIFVLAAIVVTNIAYRVLDELLQWYATKVSEHDSGALNRQLIPLLEKLVTIFLVGTALIITLKHFGYDILSLVTALGIGSLAIGMAAKDTLANMISGFTLMVDRPFRIGDRVQLTPSQWGDVLDIGLRSTKIKAPDNTLLIIPNSTLCNSNLVNLAFPEPRVKGRIDIGISYRSDVESVKQILVAIALEENDVLREPAPEAYFVSFGDSELKMSLFFWVGNYANLFAVTDRINTLILKRFRENRIEIPYPTTTVLVEKEN